jgi:hypothetical protein
MKQNPGYWSTDRGDRGVACGQKICGAGIQAALLLARGMPRRPKEVVYSAPLIGSATYKLATVVAV